MDIVTLNHRVQEGYYELLRPDGRTIWRRDWEDLVEPGLVVEMRMTPLKRQDPFTPSQPLTRAFTSTTEGETLNTDSDYRGGIGK